MGCGIRSLIGLANFRPVQTFQCSTPTTNIRREPKSSFGENQLLPGSISFSLLTTSHPKTLYDLPVRSSISLSTYFNLLMASSPGFGSYACYQLRAINTRFPYGSVVLAHFTSNMHKLVGSFFNRHAVPRCNIGVQLLVDIRFQVYFTALIGLLFTFPSRY